MASGKEAIPKMLAGSSMDLERARQTDEDDVRGPKMATGNVERMNQAIRNSSTEVDEHNDMIMMSTSRINWEDFLQAAPMSITLLGQLMVLASTKDFKLPTSASKGLKHSESFRTSLVQISNRGWEAFNEAHKNMHQIQISSVNVQKHVKFALRIISKGTPANVKHLLPKPLKSIENIANECLTLSSATEKKFNDVMELIGNVLVSCTEAKGQYEDDLQKTEAALRVAEKSREFVSKEQEESAEQLVKMEKQLEEAREVYKEALSAMPSAGKLIWATFVENITGGPKTGRDQHDPSADSRPDVEQPVSKESHPIYKHAERLNNICTDLAALVKKPEDTDKKEDENPASVKKPEDTDRKKDENSASVKKPEDTDRKKDENPASVKKPEDTDRKKETDLYFLKESARQLQQQISSEPESKAREGALHVCQQAISLCDSLIKLNNTLKAQTSDDREKVFKECKKSAEEMKNSCKEFLDKSIGYSEYIPSKTNALPLPKSTSQKPMSVRDSICDTWQSKLKSAEEQLKNAQQRVDEAQCHSRKTSAALYEIILKISECNLEKINFDEICNILIQGIHSLAEVREQWGKLVKFFQEISNIIKCTLNTSLKEFTEYVTVGSEMILEGDKLDDFLLGTIYEQAFSASKVAHAVHHISSLYIEVSNTAIMDTLASLPKLLVLKNAPGTSTQSNMEKLMSNCEQTQKVITEMVEKKQAEFHSALSGRINKIKCELQAVPPVEPMSTQKAVKRKSGVSKNKSATSKAMSEKKLAASKEKDPLRLAKRIRRV